MKTPNKQTRRFGLFIYCHILHWYTYIYYWYIGIIIRLLQYCNRNSIIRHNNQCKFNIIEYCLCIRTSRILSFKSKKKICPPLTLPNWNIIRSLPLIRLELSLPPSLQLHATRVAQLNSSARSYYMISARVNALSLGKNPPLKLLRSLARVFPPLLCTPLDLQIAQAKARSELDHPLSRRDWRAHLLRRGSQGEGGRDSTRACIIDSRVLFLYTAREYEIS